MNYFICQDGRESMEPDFNAEDTGSIPVKNIKEMREKFLIE